MRDNRHLDELRIIANQRTEERDYWLEKLSGELEKCGFPYDYKKAGDDKPSVDVVSETFPQTLSSALSKLSTGSDVRLHIILVSVLILLLNKYTGKNDIIVGTPILKPDVKADFTNTTIALRTRIKEGMTFKELLFDVRQTCSEAVKNQGYPIEILIDELGLPFVEGNFPLFDTAILVENIHEKRHIRSVTPGMIFSFSRVGENIDCGLEYDSCLYEPSTAGRIMNHFRRLLEAVLTDVEMKIPAVDILSQEEKRQLLYDFNDTAAAYPKDKTIQALFQEQVERNPHNIALIGPANSNTRDKGTGSTMKERISLTYGQLSRKADNLAALLAQKGVGPDSIVGLLAERSIEMIIAIFAILKAGGAYLPIEPQSPEARKSYMLKESKTTLLLTTRSLTEEVEKLQALPLETIYIEESNRQEVKGTGHEPAVGARHAVPEEQERRGEPCVPPPLRPETDPTLNSPTLNPSPGNLAYIIYTSGTTGKPKGILTRHYNVIRVVKDTNYIDFKSDDKVLQLSNYAFDGSVFDIYGALLNGATLTLVDEQRVSAVDKLAGLIRLEKITIFFVTTALFNALVELNIESFATVRKVLFGGERVSVEHSKKALAYMGKGRILHVYGPTETTVYATYYPIDHIEDKNITIPIGRPIANTSLFVLDKNLQPVPIGVQGELYIGGDGLARGYMNRPELTAEKFASGPAARGAVEGRGGLADVGAGLAPARESFVFDGQPQGLPLQLPTSELPTSNFQLPNFQLIYKTGDLVRWNYEGYIEFLGRVDTQVKVRGFRIELGEIESHLLSFPGVKEALVLAREYKSGDRYLCAYVVVKPKEHETRRGKEAGAPTAAELRKHLSQSLPGYMVPAYYTFLEKMPLTPNGKIDQKALPEPEARAAGVYVVPRDEVEKRMTAIWSAVLGIEEEKIGIDDNFFELGGHSLKVTKLVYFIRKEFEVNMDLKDVFANSCIRELAQIIKAAEEQQYVAIRAVEEKEYYNLSYAQRRLWVLCQFEEDSTAYNMPGAIVFSGLFDAAAFSKAIQTLADRHESLRTVFISVAGDPFQRVIKNLKVNLGQIDLRQLEEEEKEKEARQIYLDDANSPIDLERGPLFRFKLVRLEEEKNLLIHNFHHIINDGWSQGNIYNEIITLYNTYRANKDNPFPPLGLQYKDYTRWHNNLISSGIFNESRNYWMEKFKDKPNGIELPIDHPRKPLQTFNGGRISFTIDGEKTGQLSRFSADEDVTFFMGLLALVAILLYKYSGQEDILIGAPIANRRQPELHPVVGFLVNTLIFRTRVKPGLSFRQFLNHIKKETLECYEYQDYPFDLLVEQLGLDRDLSQSPLFNFMLAHNNAETEENVQAMEGLETSPYAFEVDYNMSKFDLIFHLNEFADSLHPVIEYNSDLFERSTIERMVDNFLTLTDNIIAHPDAPISNLNIISEAEYETIIHRFNDSSCPFPQLTIREMFENQVEKSADKYAVIFHEDKITYKDLNMEANRLAHYLGNTYHVQPNDIIAISMERSIDMIVVLLGILKSGAAYLALDPSYPKDRVHHVLENSRTDLLITDKKRPELFADYSGTIIDITTCIEAVSRESTGNPEIRNRLSDILYVNYTSGSTGMPNGAMLSQDCLSNLIYWQSEKTTIDCSLRCLQFTSINFCVSFQEIMGTLTSGGELYLIGDVERQDIDYLLDFLSKYQVEILFLPFSYLNFLFNESTRWDQSFNHNLKHIITAGEQLKVTSGLKRFLDLNPDLQLHNHYGSTEMHVVTSYTLDASSAEQTPIPPAGKPIGNVKIYILDEHLKPVPMGVWGELFVAGRSEIPGYINNDELNREKLVLHPELSENNQRLYRSGDSGRWLEDGNIELRGRKDFLVKIRGFRVELGEIESKLLALEQVRECVVVDREDAAGQKYLVAYVVKDNIDIGEINRILNNDLPLYMIPQVVFLEKLPLMPNGKVDREKLPEPEMALDKEYKAPGNEVEKKLGEIWSDILGLEQERISVDANFFELGGHSLRATTLVSRIHKEFDVKVPLVEIFRFPTVSEISSFIKSLETETFTGIEAVKEKEYYALSSAQKRLYVQQHMQLDSKIYNLPSVMRLVGKLKKEWLEEVFGKLIRRHETLRTSFPQVDGEPVQKIHWPEEIEFGIEYFSGEQERRREPCVPPPLCSYDDIIDRFIRPFDLSKPPLLRVGLIETGEEEHIFLVDMHHIVTDGTSMGILVREFMALYSGEELPPLTIRYKDFSEWQNRMFQSADFKKQEAYWLKQFAGPLPVLDLPGDFPENQPDDSGGGYVFFEIEPHMTAEIRKLVSETGTTLFIILLAIYTVLLSKYTGKEDIVVGTGIAGRRHADLDNVLGLFINMLALRNRPEKGKTFFKFLEEVKQAAFDGYANQDYQYEELVRSLDLQGNAAGSPLFETIFQVQNMEIPELKIPGLELKPYDYEFRISRHPLIIYATEAGDKINMMLLYSTRVFLHETAEKLAERFLEVVEQVVRNREIKLQDIILSFDLEKLETPVLQEEQGDFEF